MVSDRELLLMSEEKFSAFTKGRKAKQRKKIRKLRVRIKQRKKALSKFKMFARSFKRRNPLKPFAKVIRKI